MQCIRDGREAASSKITAQGGQRKVPHKVITVVGILYSLKSQTWSSSSEWFYLLFYY